MTHGSATEGGAEIFERGPSVVVVLLEGDSAVLVQQWREAVGAETVELVQERLEPGELPFQAAARGVAEECAVRASGWEEHGSFWAVPAYSTQRVHVFSATVEARLPGDGPRSTQLVHCEPADLDLLLDDAVSIAGLSVFRRSTSVRAAPGAELAD
jgi:8-oxo-dGTP pyrophosphatase MutT (NUDIX family)